jgi:hypothetical protein
MSSRYIVFSFCRVSGFVFRSRYPCPLFPPCLLQHVLANIRPATAADGPRRNHLQRLHFVNVCLESPLRGVSLATVGGRRAFVAARVIRRPLRGNTALVVARFSIEMQRRNIRTAYPTESNIARVHLAHSFPADADGLPRFLPLGQPPLRPLRDKIGHLLPAATWGHALLRITGFSLVHFKNR